MSNQCHTMQRLVEDGFAEAFPCVLLTAKGMPDLATRIFLHKARICTRDQILTRDLIT